jgi:hypothetical protein
VSLAALIIAVVAVVVSICGFAWSVVWSIYQHRQVTRGRLYVRASFALVLSPMRPGVLGPGVQVVAVSATNAGMVPVTVTAAVAHVKGVKEQHLLLAVWLLQIPRPLPLKLAPGETWRGNLDPQWLRDGAAKLAPGRSSWKLQIAVRDTADRLYEARTLTL